MTRAVSRQPVSPGRCDVCGGEGFLELEPLRPGSAKFACLICRADYQRYVAEIEKRS